jgi:glucose/arabinose dehydrogenase
VGQEGFAAELWTYGNRNIQGLDFNPATGELWGHEHGPQGGDEINILRPGLNFGWPLATFGQQYGGGVIGDTAGAGLTQPLLYWTPSIAPCGMTFLRSDVYPGWKGSLFIGALVGQHLNRTAFQNDQPISEDRYFVGEGRIRNVGQSPDGYIYLANETEGSLVKLVPEFTE